MTLKVDKAGRVILPKPVRDRLGLRAEPAQHRPSVVKSASGLCVYTGEVPAGFDAARAVQDDREDRIRKLAGL